MIILPEFAAEISGACKAGLRGNDGNSLLRRVKQSGCAGEPVADKVCYRGNMNAGLEYVQGAAFAEGGGCCDHVERELFLIVVVDVLHHSLQPGLSVVRPGKRCLTGSRLQMSG